VFRAPLLPIFEDMLNARAVQDTGLFHYAAIQQLVSDHKNRRINAGYQLWALLTLFLWLKKLEYSGGNWHQLFTG